MSALHWNENIRSWKTHCKTEIQSYIHYIVTYRTYQYDSVHYTPILFACTKFHAWTWSWNSCSILPNPNCKDMSCTWETQLSLSHQIRNKWHAAMFSPLKSPSNLLSDHCNLLFAAIAQRTARHFSGTRPAATQRQLDQHIFGELRGNFKNTTTPMSIRRVVVLCFLWNTREKLFYKW